jgi:hypothetical protein
LAFGNRTLKDNIFFQLKSKDIIIKLKIMIKDKTIKFSQIKNGKRNPVNLTQL